MRCVQSGRVLRSGERELRVRFPQAWQSEVKAGNFESQCSPRVAQVMLSVDYENPRDAWVERDRMIDNEAKKKINPIVYLLFSM